MKCRRAHLDQEIGVPSSGEPALQAQEGIFHWHLIPSSLSCTTVQLAGPPEVQAPEMLQQPSHQVLRAIFFGFLYLPFLYFLELILLLHWSIVEFWCCGCSPCSANGFTYTYTYISSYSRSFLYSLLETGCVGFPALCSRSF